MARLSEHRGSPWGLLVGGVAVLLAAMLIWAAWLNNGAERTLRGMAGAADLPAFRLPELPQVPRLPDAPKPVPR